MSGFRIFNPHQTYCRQLGNSPVIYLNGNYIMFPIRYGHCILKIFLTDKVRQNKSGTTSFHYIRQIFQSKTYVGPTTIGDLPLDCRLAKMLIYGCLLQCVDAVATMAAFLSQRSVFRAPAELRDEIHKLEEAHKEAEASKKDDEDRN